MTTHHYCNSEGQHVYSRNDLLVAVIERESHCYLLRRVLDGRELERQRYGSLERAELAALHFARDSTRATLEPAPLLARARTTLHASRSARLREAADALRRRVVIRGRPWLGRRAQAPQQAL